VVRALHAPLRRGGGGAGRPYPAHPYSSRVALGGRGGRRRPRCPTTPRPPTPVHAQVPRLSLYVEHPACGNVPHLARFQPRSASSPRWVKKPAVLPVNPLLSGSMQLEMLVRIYARCKKKSSWPMCVPPPTVHRPRYGRRTSTGGGPQPAFDDTLSEDGETTARTNRTGPSTYHSAGETTARWVPHRRYGVSPLRITAG
jgi:hypothetical protein